MIFEGMAFSRGVSGIVSKGSCAKVNCSVRGVPVGVEKCLVFDAQNSIFT